MSCNCAVLEWHALFKSSDLKGVFAKNENQFNFKQIIQILQYFILFFNYFVLNLIISVVACATI